MPAGTLPLSHRLFPVPAASFSGFIGEIASDGGPVFGEELGVIPLQLVDDPLERHIRKGPMVVHVLHVPVSLPVEFVKEAIRFAVEFQGPDAELIAEAHVEGRRDLEPAALQENLRVTVENENVRFHELPEPLRAQMVFYVGKPDP